MTNLDKFRLPIYKRHNILMLLREWRVPRKPLLVVTCIVLGILIYIGEKFLIEHNVRLARESEVRDLVLAHYKLTTSGAPGYVKTDWTDGTVDIVVRKPK